MGVDVNSYLIYGFRVPGVDIVKPNMNNQEFVEGYLEKDENDIENITDCWYDYLIDHDLVVQENGYEDYKNSDWYIGIAVAWEGIVNIDKITSLSIQHEAEVYNALYDIIGNEAFNDDKYTVNLHLVTIWS